MDSRSVVSNWRWSVSPPPPPQDHQELARLAAEGVEVDDMEAFGKELAAEAKAEAKDVEEVRLDKEEEAHWEKCHADWCTHCVHYLHTNLLDICQFNDHKDKCSQCMAQGQGSGSACVVVCILNPGLDMVQMLMSSLL